MLGKGLDKETESTANSLWCDLRVRLLTNCDGVMRTSLPLGIPPSSDQTVQVPGCFQAFRHGFRKDRPEWASNTGTPYITSRSMGDEGG